VARGWGIPAVVGASEVELETDGIRVGTQRLASGSQVTIDGGTGRVYPGAIGGASTVSPEAETLLAWAAELGVEIGPEAPAAPGDAQQIDRSEVLLMLAIKGFALPDALAEALSSSPDLVRTALDELAEAGLAEASAGAMRPTQGGRDAAVRALAREGDGWGREAAASALDAFVELDHRVKEVVTDWQMRRTDGVEGMNDHADADYDRGVLARLRDVHAAALAWLEPHATAVPRLGRYRLRLDRAARLAADDGRYVASPRVDSYHSIWFELHEELILLCGRTREEEVAAGRA